MAVLLNIRKSVLRKPSPPARLEPIGYAFAGASSVRLAERRNLRSHFPQKFYLPLNQPLTPKNRLRPICPAGKLKAKSEVSIANPSLIFRCNAPHPNPILSQPSSPRGNNSPPKPWKTRLLPARRHYIYTRDRNALPALFFPEPKSTPITRVPP